MYKVSAILILLPALVFSQTPVRSCSSGNHNLPNRVFFGAGNHDSPDELINRHCTNPPCQLSRQQGSGSTLVEFTSNIDTPTIWPFIRARAFGIWVTQDPPAGVQSNPCGILVKGSCPLVNGASYEYVLTLPIASNTPLINTETEISLRTTNRSDAPTIFCYAVENQIVA